jgi:hypothetical protein
MRKWLVFSLLAASVAAQAIVIYPMPFFPTASPMQEDFDSIAPGSYFGVQVFSAPVTATAYALNPGFGMIDVLTATPPALSAPQTLVGNGTDVAIRMFPGMRRFGGYFRGNVTASGVAPTAARFDFYSISNVLIGSQTVPLTGAWTWHGFMTVPQLWNRVEIFGNASGSFGGVEMDDIRVRQF